MDGETGSVSSERGEERERERGRGRKGMDVNTKTATVKFSKVCATYYIIISHLTFDLCDSSPSH